MAESRNRAACTDELVLTIDTLNDTELGTPGDGFFTISNV